MPTIYRKSMTLKDFLSQNDRFAANSGCLLKEVREGYARAELVVTSEHLNAGGVCQGGAYFTLADIALAAVMNSRGTLTFGIENNIVFLHSAKTGDTLVAEAVEVYNHHKIPYVDQPAWRTLLRRHRYGIQKSRRSSDRRLGIIFILVLVESPSR